MLGSNEVTLFCDGLEGEVLVHVKYVDKVGGFLNGDVVFMQGGTEMGKTNQALVLRQEGIFFTQMAKWNKIYIWIRSGLKPSGEVCALLHWAEIEAELQIKEMAMEVHYWQDRDFAKTENCHTKKKRKQKKKKKEKMQNFPKN